MARKKIREEAKKYFMQNVVMTVDSREQENSKILDTFNALNIKYEVKQGTGIAFIYGDYSFCIDGKDYRDEVIFERKANLEELFGNVNAKNQTDKHTDDLRNNLERELRKMNQYKVAEKWLVFGGANNLNEVKNYKFPYWKKVKDPSPGLIHQSKIAGKTIYGTLMSWQSANRHNFKMYCSKNEADLALHMVSASYYYWRNEQKEKGNIKNNYFYF